MSRKALIEGNTEPVTCAEYSEVACDNLGDEDYSLFDDVSNYHLNKSSFTTAKKACCVCGGGNRTVHEVPLSEDPVEEVKCMDNPEFRTITGHDCSYFTTHVDSMNASLISGECIETYAKELMDYFGEDFYSLANEECCICGGGLWNYQIEGEGGYTTTDLNMSPAVERERPIRYDMSVPSGCVDLRLWEDPVGTGCDWQRGFFIDHFKEYPDVVEMLYTNKSEGMVAVDINAFIYDALYDGHNPYNACCSNQTLEDDSGGVFSDKIISVMEDTKVTCIGKNKKELNFRDDLNAENFAYFIMNVFLNIC